jgi:hypothetical protein
MTNTRLSGRLERSVRVREHHSNGLCVATIDNQPSYYHNVAQRPSTDFTHFFNTVFDAEERRY